MHAHLHARPARLLPCRAFAFFLPVAAVRCSASLSPFCFNIVYAADFFFFFLPLTFTRTPRLNRRWLEIRTYIARYCTLTSVPAIFKPCLIASAPPRGVWREEAKSRLHTGLQHPRKWNKRNTHRGTHRTEIKTHSLAGVTLSRPFIFLLTKERRSCLNKAVQFAAIPTTS